MDWGQAHWYWFAGGVLLIALEAVAPGAVLLWFGVAAICTGFVALFTDASLDLQTLNFAVIAVISTVGFRYWSKQNPREHDPAADRLNQPGQDLIGRRLVLATAIENGSGRVKVADSSWRCHGPDLPEGAAVVVTGVESGSLIVAAASDS